MIYFYPGNLGNEALIVTRDDEVFALGSNGAGCLGQGDMHSSLHPKQVEALCCKVRLKDHPNSVLMQYIWLFLGLGDMHSSLHLKQIEAICWK